MPCAQRVICRSNQSVFFLPRLSDRLSAKNFRPQAAVFPARAIRSFASKRRFLRMPVLLIVRLFLEEARQLRHSRPEVSAWIPIPAKTEDSVSSAARMTVLFSSLPLSTSIFSMPRFLGRLSSFPPSPSSGGLFSSWPCRPFSWLPFFIIFLKKLWAEYTMSHGKSKDDALT